MTDFKFSELFGENLEAKTGEVNTDGLLTGVDAVGIYFSAHWCPPCRGFTPKFAEAYTAQKEAGKKFEVVFASSDSDEASFKDYYKDMPWYALPFSNRELKEKLATKYGCNGIPFLVILDGKDGSVITTNGRGAVSGQNFVQDFPYYPKAMYDTAESMDGIDEGTSLLLIQNQAGEETKKANSEFLLKFATENKGLFGKYFTVNGNDATTNFIRKEMSLFSKVEHPHSLVKQEDTSTAYIEMFGNKERAINWRCDFCSKMGGKALEHHHCKECQYDLCEICIKKLQEETPEEAKQPMLRLLNLSKEEYFEPLEGKTSISEENVKALAEDFKEGKLSVKKLASTQVKE